MNDPSNVEPGSGVGAPTENEVAPKRCSGASGSALSPKQLHTLRHSLGTGERGTKKEYRNYYATDEGDEAVESLVTLGLMEKGRRVNEPPDPMFYYHVTDAGKKAAKPNTKGQPPQVG